MAFSKIPNWKNYIHKNKRVIALTGLVATSSVIIYNTNTNRISNDSKILNQFTNQLFPLIKNLPTPPSRDDLLKNLGSPIDPKKDGKPSSEDYKAEDASAKFDLIIVGGGAVGSGTAVDASTRGLKVLLLEKEDFASGTSSRSTKMAHGGVRYLEKAIFQLSKAQLNLVIEALNERASILSNAPHLAKTLPIMIPVYHWYQLPYFYAGCLLYDVFAGSQALKYSYIMTKSSAMSKHPQLKTDGLVGGLVYHDGLFNDARMNITLALTAQKNGATVLNYTEVKQILKDSNGNSKGVRVLDRETGKEYIVKSDAIINATGPFGDTLLEMDKDIKGLPTNKILNEATQLKMVVPSGGVHIMLPEWYCARDMGLLDASTSDGRVMFFLPWQGKVLAGTTDVPLTKVPKNPVATEDEITDILKELQKYIKFEVKRDDVLSAWSGVRPLVRNPANVPDVDQNDPIAVAAAASASTQGLVRSHLVYDSPNGLVTISGGKWTTYREMSQEVVDHIISKTPEFQNLNLLNCQTRDYKLIGAENYDSTLEARLGQEYRVPDLIAAHLSNNYGDRAPIILELFNDPRHPENKLPISLFSYKLTPDLVHNSSWLSWFYKSSSSSSKQDQKLTNPTSFYNSCEYPFTVAELKYSMKYEYTRTPVDFLARRTRLAFLDSKSALDSIDGVVEIMSNELNWNKSKKNKERLNAIHYISHMGILNNVSPYDADLSK
ncbi:hypothetical protein B5S32_g4079 [[Candida] boidinii]|nr:hypothetical protein B5S32_g4079 [[Candida] boidinii]